jgi:hypothetical protein
MLKVRFAQGVRYAKRTPSMRSEVENGGDGGGDGGDDGVRSCG